MEWAKKVTTFYIRITDRSHFKEEQVTVGPNNFLQTAASFALNKKVFNDNLQHFNDEVIVEGKNETEENAQFVAIMDSRRKKLISSAENLSTDFMQIRDFFKSKMPYSFNLTEVLGAKKQNTQELMYKFIDQQYLEDEFGYSELSNSLFSYRHNYVEKLEKKKSLFSRNNNEDSDSQTQHTGEQKQFQRDLGYTRESFIKEIKDHFSQLTEEFIGDLKVAVLLNNKMVFAPKKDDQYNKSHNERNRPKKFYIHQNDFKKTLQDFPFIKELMENRMEGFKKAYNLDLQKVLDITRGDFKYGKLEIAGTLAIAIKNTGEILNKCLGVVLGDVFKEAIEKTREPIDQMARENSEKAKGDFIGRMNNTYGKNKLWQDTADRVWPGFGEME